MARPTLSCLSQRLLDARNNRAELYSDHLGHAGNRVLIWRVDQFSSTSKATSLLPVIQILVESGCLYMLFLLADLVALVLESPALLFLNQIVSPITSICFFLIIVRVGLSKHGSSAKASEPWPSMGSVNVRHEFSIHRELRSELSVMEGGDVIPMNKIDGASLSQSDA